MVIDGGNLAGLTDVGEGVGGKDDDVGGVAGADEADVDRGSTQRRADRIPAWMSLRADLRWVIQPDMPWSRSKSAFRESKVLVDIGGHIPSTPASVTVTFPASPGGSSALVVLDGLLQIQLHLSCIVWNVLRSRTTWSRSSNCASLKVFCCCCLPPRVTFYLHNPQLPLRNNTSSIKPAFLPASIPAACPLRT